MKEIIKMKLDRPAKKNGGDRYTGELSGIEINIYVPQSFSRKSDTPIKQITLTLEKEE